MNRSPVVALALCSMVISGCLFTGAVKDSDLADLDAHVASLNQRVDTLEVSRTAGTSAAVAADAGSLAAFAGAGSGGSASGGAGWSLAFSFGGSMRKLVRGLTNVVTGWVEVPKRVQETTAQSGAFSGFTWGLLRGVGRGFIRTVGGAYEVITFPFPAPPGYRPVMRPTYVFTDDEADEVQ